MYKYRHFPILFGLAGLLLLLLVFPISFDNNDDQYMFFISSGAMSGHSMPDLLLTHFFIGKILNLLFSFSKQVNWYTLYLQASLTLAFGAVFLVITAGQQSFLKKTFWILFVLPGIAALCFIKLQFTTVALFCGFAALLCLQSELPQVPKYVLAFFLVALSILIRKESFYLVILFSVPIVLTKGCNRKTLKYDALWAFLVIAFFLVSTYLNSREAAYRQQDTYSYLAAQDIIAAKPIRYDDLLLKKYHFSKDDLTLLQNWFPADQAYMTGSQIVRLAEALRSSRDLQEIRQELIRTAIAERYILSLYLLSLLGVVFFARGGRRISLLNLAAVVLLFIYLSAYSRLPHRVIYPILAYLLLANLLLFMHQNKNNNIGHIALLLFFLLGSYKFYCVSKLYSINREYHRKFEQYQQEIRSHPDQLFIGLYDGYPVEYMNAYTLPQDPGAGHNLILTGWYAYSPYHRSLLETHGLHNLSSDLETKKNVFFLTDSEGILNAYIKVMQQRYGIKCHFEDVQKNYTTLRPKALVFDH